VKRTRHERAAAVAAKRPADASIDAELTWREDVDPRRLRRVARILADILDNVAAPGEPGRR
jgi:hypothetical protein